MIFLYSFLSLKRWMCTCCMKTFALTCSLWNTLTHSMIFGWDLPTTCHRRLCQTTKWLFVHGPSVLYKFQSAVWNVPAIHVDSKYVTNSSILGNSGVSAFIACHVIWANEWELRQELLFCIWMTLVALYYIRIGFVDQCLRIFS